MRSVSADGMTPLHFACQAGFADCAELLLDKNADIDALDASKETPLHKVAYWDIKNADYLK